MFICFWERMCTHVHASGGGTEREGDRGSEAGSELIAPCGTWTLELWDHDLSQSRPLNLLSHPGSPDVVSFLVEPVWSFCWRNNFLIPWFLVDELNCFLPVWFLWAFLSISGLRTDLMASSGVFPGLQPGIGLSNDKMCCRAVLSGCPLKLTFP